MGYGILVVDDEPVVRTLVGTVLRSAGYGTVTEAEDGLAAYELIQASNAEIGLVITDIQMPRMNGVELTKRLIAEFPAIKVVCISGLTQDVAPNGHYFLAKPFTPQALLAIVREAFQSSLDDDVQVKTTAASGRHQNENNLRAQLIEAKEKLNTANQEYRRLMEICSDVENNVDGLLALRQAMTARQNAFNEYSKALEHWRESLKSEPRYEVPAARVD